MKSSLLSSRYMLTGLSMLFGSTAATLDSAVAAEDSTSYVFLQKFPLEGTFNSIFHTEVLVCPKEGFSSTDQSHLDDLISNLQDFTEIPKDWWTSKTANCVEFGYGGAVCTERCCGSPHTAKQKQFPLNDRRAVIGNADTTQKTLFLYGTSGSLTAEQARQELCPPDDNHPGCWSNWSGTDYNPLTNNCNTYTSALLHCVFGLSEAKPNLGPSDMVTVTCDKCPLFSGGGKINNAVTEERLLLRG